MKLSISVGKNIAPGMKRTLPSWWFFTNPFEKYAQVKLDHFPTDSDENKQTCETAIPKFNMASEKLPSQ